MSIELMDRVEKADFAMAGFGQQVLAPYECIQVVTSEPGQGHHQYKIE